MYKLFFFSVYFKSNDILSMIEDTQGNQSDDDLKPAIKYLCEILITPFYVACNHMKKR